MKKLFVIGLVATLATAQAEEAKTSESSSTSSTKLESIKKNQTPANTTGQTDADDVITNRKLRAETGSKKTLSFSAALGYSGGSIKDPQSEKRPNITGDIGTQEDVSADGSLSVKARISPLQNISLGVGVGMDKPFHDDRKTRRERSYVSDPGVTFTQLAKVGPTQSVTQVSGSLYTNDFNRSWGYISSVGLSQTFMYDFNGSPFSIGSAFTFSKNFFDKASGAVKGINEDTGKEVLYGKGQSDLSVGFYPTAELVLNDKLNLRTLVGFRQQHLVGKDLNDWRKPSKVYQSVGLGISLTRDIYLYPNVQFIPDSSIATDRTNVAMAAYINL